MHTFEKVCTNLPPDIGAAGGSGFGGCAGGGGVFGAAGAAGGIITSIVGLIPNFLNNSLALSLYSLVIVLFPDLVLIVS